MRVRGFVITFESLLNATKILRSIVNIIAFTTF